MSMSDPIADMLARIRSAGVGGDGTVTMPSSKLKVAIAQVLKDEGYIDSFEVRSTEGKDELEVSLKYVAGRPVIEKIERVSRPRLRIYKGHQPLPEVQSGLGVALVTDPTGKSQSGRVRRSKDYVVAQPASGSTKLPSSILAALSRALKQA